MNIYLIGYRGTGKSSVAPRLAKTLGEAWSWIDLDEALERRAGKSIREIFEIEGERSFRDREEAELAHVAAKDRLVVATGGGIIGRETSRQRLSEGWVVWLTAEVETILTRLTADACTRERRPDLTPQGGRAEVERLLGERTPIYQELADCAVATDDASLETIVARVVEGWRAFEKETAAARTSDEGASP